MAQIQAVDNLTNIGDNLVKKFPQVDKKRTTMMYLGAAIIVVLLGVFSGWKLSGRSSASVTEAPKTQVSENEAGISDESTFKDTATGLLEVEGVNGDGTHHLTRDGGPTQTVALSSTVIDLDSFVGKKVQVWGETISGQKALWLMDVGKLKVVQ